MKKIIWISAVLLLFFVTACNEGEGSDESSSDSVAGDTVEMLVKEEVAEPQEAPVSILEKKVEPIDIEDITPEEAKQKSEEIYNQVEELENVVDTLINNL